MWNFSKKYERNNTDKTIANSNEYEKLSIRITDLTQEIRVLKTDIETVKTSLDNLRGNFNRKLSGLSKEEKKEAKTETETINNDPYVAFG